jgi:anti-sigma factor RsiW
MACEEFENQISDYLENQLHLADRSQVAAHLAGCANCRALVRQLEQLDAKLSRTVKAPTLPGNFKAKVQQRIQTTAVLSATERAERRRQMQAEYAEGLARLNSFPLPSRRILEVLGYAAVVALAGWLAWRFLPQLTDLLAWPASSHGNQSLLFSLVTSAVFVVITLAAAFPRQVRRLLPVA